VKPPKLAAAKSARASWGTSGKDGRELRALVKALSTMDDPHQKLLLSVALKMARRNER